MPGDGVRNQSDGLGILHGMRRGGRTEREQNTPPPQHGKRKVRREQAEEEAEDLNGVKNDEVGVEPDVVGSVLALDADQVALNPRNHRHQLQDPAVLAASILQTGQLEPIKVVTREAYLRLFPEDADQVGDRRWISATGSQRTQAVQSTPGIPHVLAVVDDSLASSKVRFLHANFRENFDRDEPSIMDEAKAFAALAREYGRGGQKDIAKEYRTTEAYVSQRIALTKLIPELQDLLDSDEQPQRFPIETARKLANRGAEEQREVTEIVLGLPVEDQFKAWKRWSRGGVDAIIERAEQEAENVAEEGEASGDIPHARAASDDAEGATDLNAVKKGIAARAILASPFRLTLPAVDPEPLASMIEEDSESAAEAWKESLESWEAYRASVEAAFKLNAVKKL